MSVWEVAVQGRVFVVLLLAFRNVGQCTCWVIFCYGKRGDPYDQNPA